MSAMEESGKRLKALRGKRKLWQICDQVEGISKSRLSNWENATRMIGVDEAKQLAPVLGTSAEYILTLTDEQPHPQEAKLIALFRACDDRGKIAILGTAETQAGFADPKDTTHNVVDTEQSPPIQLWDKKTESPRKFGEPWAFQWGEVDRREKQSPIKRERRIIPWDYKEKKEK